MDCILDSPMHANGGCIFDNALIVHVPTSRRRGGGAGAPGPGAWKRSYPTPEHRSEDDEILAIAAAFLEMME